jgi:uncharacterized repeat protein (TIGR04138 family)
MSEINFWDAVDTIRTDDERYAPEAYGFVMDALDFTMRRMTDVRHISGVELLHGLCDFARDHYGVMSFTMLERWGVTKTDHIGNIVFHLVDAGVLSRQDADSHEEFQDVFDLCGALELTYFGEKVD